MQGAQVSGLESSRLESVKLLLSVLVLPRAVFSIITHIPGNNDAYKSCRDQLSDQPL